MEDLQAAVQAVLSDPEQMRQVAALAESLGLKPPDNPAGTSTGAGAAPAPDRPPEGGGPVASPGPALPEGLPNLTRLLSGLGNGPGGAEDRVLNALRPTLSPEGRRRVDRALRAGKLSRLAARFLTQGRERHV